MRHQTELGHEQTLVFQFEHSPVLLNEHLPGSLIKHTFSNATPILML